MTEKIYEEAIKNNKNAFAYNKAIFNKENKLIDYIILDVNPSFEDLTGLKREDIIGKKYIHDIVKNKKGPLQWLDRYEKVLIEEKKLEFEGYFEDLNMYLEVNTYSSDGLHFTTIFSDITFQKKIEEMGVYFAENMGNNIDYEKILDFAHNISGAEYGVFNLYEEDKKNFITVSVCGDSKKIERGLEILDLNLLGKSWESPDFIEDRKKKDIIYFDSIFELVQGQIPYEKTSSLSEELNFGSIAVANIKKEDNIYGEIILIFEGEKSIKNLNLFKAYLLQVGLFIEKTKLEHSLTNSQRQFYMLAEYAPIGFISCSIIGEINYANKKLLEVMGSPSYEATEKINLLEFPKLKKIGFSERLRESMEKNREITFEMAYESIWGRSSWLKVYFTPNIEGGKVIGANILIDDITEKKEILDELKEKAEKDPLTKAYNRHALETILNDSYGHKAGDTILKYLTNRVKKELREDDLIIRTGGDEFLFYIHDIREEKNAANLIERILDKISARYSIDDDFNDEKIWLDVRCSIGGALFPRDGRTIKELMTKADRALYKIKGNGKGDYHI